MKAPGIAPSGIGSGVGVESRLMSCPRRCEESIVLELPSIVSGESASAVILLIVSGGLVVTEL